MLASHSGWWHGTIRGIVSFKRIQDSYPILIGSGTTLASVKMSKSLQVTGTTRALRSDTLPLPVGFKPEMKKELGSLWIGFECVWIGLA
jgi:hypothetical protein